MLVEVEVPPKDSMKQQTMSGAQLTTEASFMTLTVGTIWQIIGKSLMQDCGCLLLLLLLQVNRWLAGMISRCWMALYEAIQWAWTSLLLVQLTAALVLRWLGVPTIMADTGVGS